MFQSILFEITLKEKDLCTGFFVSIYLAKPICYFAECFLRICLHEMKKNLFYFIFFIYLLFFYIFIYIYFTL